MQSKSYAAMSGIKQVSVESAILLYVPLLLILTITEGCPSDLCRCSTRGVIVCSHHQLEKVPHFAREMDKVYEELDLSQNDIYAIPPNAFQDLFVKSIVLNDNELIGISPRAFDDIHANLEKIDLHSTSLEVLHWGVFRNLRSLKELNMADNKLFALPMGLFDGMPELVTLTLKGNKVASLKRGVFRGLTNLREIDLSENRITEIEDDTFVDMRHLNVLNLKDNVLTYLSNRAISGLDSLEKLYLDNNRLSDILPTSLSLLPSLTTASIQGNDLTSLRSQTFSMAPTLKVLHLDNNRLHNISNKAFSGLIKLHTLSLEGNRIETMGDVCIPPGLETLSVLKLADNPLDCSCKMSWIYDSLIVPSGSFVIGQCDNPSEHKNVFLRQLDFSACERLKNCTYSDKGN